MSTATSVLVFDVMYTRQYFSNAIMFSVQSSKTDDYYFHQLIQQIQETIEE